MFSSPFVVCKFDQYVCCWNNAFDQYQNLISLRDSYTVWDSYIWGIIKQAAFVFNSDEDMRSRPLSIKSTAIENQSEITSQSDIENEVTAGNKSKPVGQSQESQSQPLLFLSSSDEDSDEENGIVPTVQSLIMWFRKICIRWTRTQFLTGLQMRCSAD